MMRKVVCIMVLCFAVAAQAVTVPVTNHSFETPALGHVNGNLPDGWSADGTDFGTEGFGTDGIQCAFTGVYDGNTTLYQLTGHTIAEGDEFLLTFDAEMTWVSGQWPASLEGGLYYDDGGARVTIDSAGNSWNAAGWDPGDAYAWGTYTVPVTIGAGDPAIGNNLGVYVTNTSPVTWGSWAGFDNVMIPEPVSMVLLGIGGLALLRRRSR